MRIGGLARLRSALGAINRQQFWAIWRRPRRIPLIGWRIGSGALLIIIGIVVIGAYAGLRHSEQPILCTSCHEMSQHYKTWSVSSHKDVKCEECHVMPGLANMVRTQAAAQRQVLVHAKSNVKPSAIQGHVPDANCKKCHPETRETVVYHGLKISHRKHWDRGIECTFCHDRVVHGQSAATKNTPSMATCFKCHDGKKARNNCGLCHETLGERRVTPFSPEWVEGHKQESRDKHTCVRCHQKDFCDSCHRLATPHPANWLPAHPREFKRDPERCAVCHTKQTQQVFCGECHKIRRAHAMDWTSKHPSVFREDPRACDKCHQGSFCNDCHKRYKEHPADWLQRHPGQAKSSPDRCRVCHAEQFCIGCHSNKVPISHSGVGWLQNHGRQATPGKCVACHKPDFCMSCHRTRKPATHSVKWLKLHPVDASRSEAACRVCHAKEACAQCHGIQMPHPASWRLEHRKAGKENRNLCGRCHETSYCNSCHRGTRPDSHGENWISKHGPSANRPNAPCANCHTKGLCASCHRSSRPPSHDSSWMRNHGAKSAKSPGRCSFCHNKSYCDNCHKSGRGKPASHDQQWMASHGKQAKVNAKPCMMCHRADSCSKCHGTPMPHPKGWMMEHKNKGASLAEGSPCFKCHSKKDFCSQCHASG